MRLTVLGGSAAGANAGQGCAGFLLNAAGTALVLDLGPGTFIELRRHVDFRELNAVVISHLHVDHYADLLALRFALAYNPIRPRQRLRLFMPPDGIALLDRLGQVITGNPADTSFFSSVFEIAEYDPAAELDLGHLTLSFTPTVHYIPCWAIRVADPRRRDADLVYSADTGPAADLTSFVTGAATLLAEATHLTVPDVPFAERGHLTARETGALAAAGAVNTLILTHMWQELGSERAVLAATGEFGGRIVVARPGVSIEW